MRGGGSEMRGSRKTERTIRKQLFFLHSLANHPCSILSCVEAGAKDILVHFSLTEYKTH